MIAAVGTAMSGSRYEVVLVGCHSDAGMSIEAMRTGVLCLYSEIDQWGKHPMAAVR